MAIKVTTSNVALTLIAAFAIVFFLVLLSGPTPVTDGQISRLERVPHDPVAQQLHTVSQQAGNQLDDTSQGDARVQPRVDTGDQPARVQVAAYIEMMCPDCARFVVHDLGAQRFPADVWSITDLRFVPWVWTLLLTLCLATTACSLYTCSEVAVCSAR